MRKRPIVLLLSLLISSASVQTSAKDVNKPLYKDAGAPVEKRVDDLLSRMTLEEKVYQLNQYTLGFNHKVTTKK